MNKELEALAILKQTIFHYTLGCLATGEEKAFKVIETALKETEKLRQLNCKLLEQKDALREELAKYKEAVEIIKSKKVNVRALFKSFYSLLDGLSVYNSQCYDRLEMESKELTREEYEFLKGIFNE